MIIRTKSSLRLDYECPCHRKTTKVLHYKVRYTISDRFILSFSDVSAIITPIKLVVTTSDTYIEIKNEFSAVCQRFAYDAYNKQEF